MRVQKIFNCTCSACQGSQLEENHVQEDDEDGRISDLLSSVLPPNEDSDREVGKKMLSPLSILKSQPFPKEFLSDNDVHVNEAPSPDNSNTEASSESPAIPDLRGPPYQEFPSGPNLLEEEEVIFNPEGESDPNLLTSDMDSRSSHSELTGLMENLNLILQGDGPIDYQGLSISELKTVINDLNKNKKRDISGDETKEGVVTSSPVVRTEEKLE